MRPYPITSELQALAQFADEALPGNKDLSENVRRQIGSAIVTILEPEDTSTWDPARAMKDNTRRVFGEYGGVNPAIETSTTFTTMDPKIMDEIFEGKLGSDEGCYLYARHFTPNNLQYGMHLAAMEDMEIGYPLTTGMSAISTFILQFCKSGDEIVSSKTVYGGTHALFENVLPDLGINTHFVDPTDIEGFKKAITSKTKMIYVETEANPTMAIADLKKLSKIAHQNGIILVVDNTFTPLTFTPAHHGADVVLHSTTKFINGRSDSMGGAIICSHKRLQQLMKNEDGNFLTKLMSTTEGRLMLTGPTMDARIAHQQNLYLNDLPIRIREHSRRAYEFASRISAMGLKVNYPGLVSHPQHELATSMMNEQYGYGGMMSVDFGSEEKAQKFVIKLQELGGGLNAVSLGYFDTLASISGKTTSSEIDEEERESMGLTSGLVRLSVGYTGNLESEWQKWEQAIREAA